MTNKKNLRLNEILSTIEFHFIYGEYNEFSLQYIYNTTYDIFCQFMIFIDFFIFMIQIYVFILICQPINIKKIQIFLDSIKIIGNLSL